MSGFFQSLLRHMACPKTGLRPSFRPTFEGLGHRFSYQPFLERLEDRTMPSLIASQILPLMTPGVTTTTVSVAPTTLVFSDTANQVVTLTATIGSTPNVGSVNFMVTNSLGTVLGTANNVPVVNGVAQTPFTVAAGTPPGTIVVSATYSASGSMGNSSFTITPDSCASSKEADAILGTAQSFAVLAGSTVTNTGSTIIGGNVGVSPGSAVTGFPPGIVMAPGTIHAADAVATQAQSDLTTAYVTLAGMPPTSNLTGMDLGGLTLTPGVYKFDNSAQLTGTLTLNALGNPDSVFVFQIGSTLTTASSSSVVMVNDGLHDNVFWQVGSSATLGTTTAFVGNIVALTSIGLNTGATIECGRALARNGAVTMDTNTIFIPGFPGAPTGAADLAPLGASANAIYVTNLYSLLLHRAADPGAAAWVNLLNQGASPASVVQDIESSPEYLNDVVIGLFQHYLNRAPDSGAQTWVNALENGATIEQVTEGIVASPEFFLKEGGGTNSGYITALYQDILNRAPDASGETGFTQALNSGVSRAAVAAVFFSSPEYFTDLVESDYLSLLGRAADPAGLASWVQALQSGATDQAVLAGILGSAEGFGRNSL